MSALMIKDAPNCSICFEPARRDSENPDQERIDTACKHIFHRACLKTWLISKTNCPVCQVFNFTFDCDQTLALTGLYNPLPARVNELTDQLFIASQLSRQEIERAEAFERTLKSLA